MTDRHLAQVSSSTGPDCEQRRASAETVKLGRILNEARCDHVEGRALAGDAAKEFMRATRQRAFEAYPAVSDTK
jgi:hypothetical protein